MTTAKLLALGDAASSQVSVARRGPRVVRRAEGGVRTAAEVDVRRSDRRPRVVAAQPLTVGKHKIWCQGGYSPNYTISIPAMATLTVVRHPCPLGSYCATDLPPSAAACAQRRGGDGSPSRTPTGIGDRR